MKESKKTGQNKRRLATVITAGAAVLAVVLLLVCKSCTTGENGTDIKGLLFDDSAVTGGWDEVDAEKIREELNQKVEAGMINISINTSPIFETGSSEGNLMIVNETVNNYPQKVVITRNDTGEVIYESGGIPVGSKIEKAKLNTPLPAGIYECTAMFHNVDASTGDSLGCAGAEITITVKA